MAFIILINFNVVLTLIFLIVIILFDLVLLKMNNEEICCLAMGNALDIL